MSKYLHPLCTMREVDYPCIGVDFDGTLSQQISYQGPGVFGDPVAGAAQAMTYLQSLGYKVAIYTSRGPASYDFIRQYCMEHNIPFDYINENPHTTIFDPNDCNIVKPNFDLYIDDKAVRFNGNWKSIVNSIVDIKFPYWLKR